MNNIMLDLETLDTTPTAVVTSIGAVAFDPESSAIGDKFYVELTDDLAIQQRHGRTISGDTVKWWMQQDVMAKRIFTEPDTQNETARVSTQVGLHEFARFIESHGGRDVQLWGNGADFDNIILGSLYEAFHGKKPWSYSRNRCFRTMKNLCPNVKVARQGTHHNALDDAITQAVHLQEIMKCLSTPR